MARFYFHTEDGRISQDEIGTELPDLRSARNEAVVVLAQLIREDPEAFWRDGAFRLTITDQAGLILFALDVSGVRSPSVSGA